MFIEDGHSSDMNFTSASNRQQQERKRLEQPFIYEPQHFNFYQHPEIPYMVKVFVPDEDGILATATSLQYNDAPWLQRGQHSVPVRLVHPKISASVGDRVGAVSLRLKIAAAHAHDALDFDFNPDDEDGTGAGGSSGVKSEAFGQSESITRRLRHILELYPEGM